MFSLLQNTAPCSCVDCDASCPKGQEPTIVPDTVNILGVDIVVGLLISSCIVAVIVAISIVLCFLCTRRSEGTNQTPRLNVIVQFDSFL